MTYQDKLAEMREHCTAKHEAFLQVVKLITELPQGQLAPPDLRDERDRLHSDFSKIMKDYIQLKDQILLKRIGLDSLFISEDVLGDRT